MAEAFARKLGGDHVEVYSAGIDPSTQIEPRVSEMMREVGCNLAGHRTKAITAIPNKEYDIVISMVGDQPYPPIMAKRHISWNIPNPKMLTEDDFRAVRNLIHMMVEELFAIFGIMPAEEEVKTRIRSVRDAIKVQIKAFKNLDHYDD